MERNEFSARRRGRGREGASAAAEREGDREGEDEEEEEEFPLARVRENRKDSLDPLRTASKVRAPVHSSGPDTTHTQRAEAHAPARPATHVRPNEPRRLLFKAFPFIVSTMCSVIRGRNSPAPSSLTIFSLHFFLLFRARRSHRCTYAARWPSGSFRFSGGLAGALCLGNSSLCCGRF